MTGKHVQMITGLVGLAFLAIFVIGLSHSISSGFAGVLGGLPFAIIVAIVLSMAAYDCWEECLKGKKGDDRQ